MAERSAVVRIKDTQYRVHENETIEVALLGDAVGAKVEFEDVLLLSDGEVRVGNPTVAGARVRAEVLAHGRGKKVIVFKMKRRKAYRRTRGHRQDYTQLRITGIEG